MPAKEYDYLKDTILVTYPDGPETYGATQAAPSSGMDTSDATAIADDIRADKTAYVASGKVTGTIEDYDGSSEPTSGKSLFAQMVDGSLTEVSASDLAGATKIRSRCFSDCENLVSVYIPDTVTDMGQYVFNNCRKLQYCRLPQGLTKINFYTLAYCSTLANIIIPDTVIRLENSAFAGCSKLQNVIIPKNVTYIGSSTFQNCGSSTNKLTVIMLPTTPPALNRTDAFTKSYLNKIIVPIGTADTYKAATNWSAFADYIEEATE